MSKYTRWYDDITSRGKHRSKMPGMETHHIIPECVGGLDIDDNKTNITAREHFICHWLLTKIYYGKERHQLLKALWMMKATNKNQKRYHTKITSRVYAALKTEYAMLQSIKVSGPGNPMYGKNWTAEQKQAHSNKITGRKQSLKEKQNQVIAMTGRKRKEFSDEWKANLSKAGAGENNSMYGKKQSDDAKAKISAKIKGRKQTEEEKEVRRHSLLALKLKKPKKLCLHCNQEVAVNGYARWHGDRCKQNPANKKD